jgi:hypothetical protein
MVAGPQQMRVTLGGPMALSFFIGLTYNLMLYFLCRILDRQHGLKAFLCDHVSVGRSAAGTRGWGKDD